MLAYTANPKRRTQSSGLPPALTAVIVIAALYFGKEILIPFALALLLSFLLTFPITWLERLKIGRTPAVGIVLLFAIAAGSGLLWLGIVQLSGILKSLPEYQANIVKKVQGLRNPAGLGLASAVNNITGLKDRITANKSPNQQPPVPVQVVNTKSGFLASMGLMSASVAHYLAVAAAVLVLTLFMLINRGHLRNRMFRLMGQGHLVVMTTALDDAATRVSRYLLTQSAVNGTFGCLLGFGLYWIGVPYAPFWGVLAAFLRFIPYVGTLMAGVCPFVLALAVFSGWLRPLLTVGIFALLEGITSSIVEPWLYATRTGISSLAILFSAAFWTLIWGPIGLILSTPMTVCLAVLGRHLPPLEFLHVLLGDDPVLAPPIQYYQRLLALDEDEAAEVAETYLKGRTVAEVYDEMLIPALSMAEQDRHAERLDHQRTIFIIQSARDLVEEFGERNPELAQPTGAQKLSIVCVPSRDDADELVGLMLVQVLRHVGYDAELMPIDSDVKAFTSSLGRHVDYVFVSALPPFAIFHARTTCRKLRKHNPHLKIVLGLWTSSLPSEKIKERLSSMCSDLVVTSLAEAQAILVNSESNLYSETTLLTDGISGSGV